MNRALVYLAATLLKRRGLLFLRDLRRPLQLLSFLLGSTVLGVLFYYRNYDFVGQCVRNTPLVFFLSLLLIVSLIRALFQRGMVFDQADIEFLLAGPFRQEHLIFYRLIPSYLGSICTVAIFSVLFWNHFRHPIMTGLAIAFFQLICAHISMGVSIFSGGLSERVFSRLRLIAGIIIFVYCVLWIQKALHDSSAGEQPGKWETTGGRVFSKIFFYPVVDPGTIAMRANALTGLPGIVEKLVSAPSSDLSLGISILILIPFCWISLRLLSRMQTGLFEPVLKANDRRATARQKNQYGTPGFFRNVETSADLPTLRILQGALGALIWKNLICAWRSKGRLLYALACMFVVTASALTVVLALRNMSEGEDLFELNMVVPSMIAFLAFLLQTALPFDLRLDSFHLGTLKTLPIAPRKLAIGLIAVPCVLSLLFQGCSLLILSIFTPFLSSILAAMVFGFPAAIFTIQLTWNINYILTIVGSSAQTRVRKANAISVFVVLSALIALFFPAAYVQSIMIKGNLRGPGLFYGVLIQYIVGLILLMVFTKLVGRPETKFQTAA